MSVPSLSSLCSRWRLLLLPLLLVATTGALAQQQPAVTAELTPNPLAPNQIATYTITVDGGNPSGVPVLKLPPGWITGGDVSTQNEISFVNGVQSISVSFSWRVTCPQEGVFTIPAHEVPVGARNLKSNEVQVEVKAGAAAPAPNGPNQDQNNGLGRLEPILQLHMAKTEFYQGEIVPVSATLYVPRNLQLRRVGLIEVEKTDLAIQRFPQQAEQSLEVLNGQRYVAYLFRSSLSALKPGRMKVGPSKTELIADMPLPNRGGFPFGFAPMEERKLTVKAVDIPINVLPLPAEGKPPGFSGAVGDFTLSSSANATEVSVGDPVAVDLMIQGQGNFDAIEAPKLSSAAGWKTYPPKRYNVDTGDPNTADLINRRLGFNCILVPEKVMGEIPSFEFSFFSPRTKQYVHLRSQPIPIAIKGSAAPAAPAAGVASSGEPAAPASAPVPKAEITDILMPIAAQARFAAPSIPLLSDRRFTLANGALLLAFVALIGSITWQRAEARRKLSADFALQQRWDEVAVGGLSEAEFYSRAVRYAQVVSPASLPDSMQTVMAAYETLNFAGPSAGTQPVDPAKRAEVLAVLKKLTAKPAGPPPLPGATVSAVLLLGLMTVASVAEAAELAEVTASPQEQYQAAVKALEKGDFKGAQKMAEALVRSGGISPEVFTLLGHAAYRQKNEGLAAMWYQRAQMFPASAPELRQNLRHIQEANHFLTFERNEWVERVGFWFSRNTWMLMAAVGGWLAVFSIATLALGARAPLSGWAIGALVAGAGIAAVCVIGYAVRPGIEDLRPLVFVTSPSAMVHTAATQVSGTVMQVLPAGSVVRSLSTRGNWTYVEIPQGPQEKDTLRGWLPSNQIEPWWPYDASKLP